VTNLIGAQDVHKGRPEEKKKGGRGKNNAVRLCFIFQGIRKYRKVFTQRRSKSWRGSKLKPSFEQRRLYKRVGTEGK